jgi:hypothetical protein
MPENHLVPFLYVLIRDEVTPGSIERIMKDLEKLKNSGDEASYSNEFLVAYARSLAERLLDS